MTYGKSPARRALRAAEQAGSEWAVEIDGDGTIRIVRRADVWILSQPGPKLTRSEAIRHALRDYLIGLGYLKAARDEFGQTG